MKLLISTENVHRDEQKEIKNYLEQNCWKADELSSTELVGLQSLINYVINQRINDQASNLSYLELINLKNKLYHH